MVLLVAGTTGLLGVPIAGAAPPSDPTIISGPLAPITDRHRLHVQLRGCDGVHVSIAVSTPVSPPPATSARSHRWPHGRCHILGTASIGGETSGAATRTFTVDDDAACPPPAHRAERPHDQCGADLHVHLHRGHGVTARSTIPRRTSSAPAPSHQVHLPMRSTRSTSPPPTPPETRAPPDHAPSLSSLPAFARQCSRAERPHERRDADLHVHLHRGHGALLDRQFHAEHRVHQPVHTECARRRAPHLLRHRDRRRRKHQRTRITPLHGRHDGAGHEHHDDDPGHHRDDDALDRLHGDRSSGDLRVQARRRSLRCVYVTRRSRRLSPTAVTRSRYAHRTASATSIPRPRPQPGLSMRRPRD